MDLLRFLRSLEEFLYEVVTWLLLYPRTFWRAVVHPIKLASYVEAEMGEDPTVQFRDLVSPLLFLMLTILFAHGLELALHLPIDFGASEIAKDITASDQSLLIFRAVVNSLFPLLMAAGMLRTQGQSVDRETLHRPFFLQCFFAAPFAVFVSIASVLGRLEDERLKLAGAVVLLADAAWYIGVETELFHSRLGLGRLHAFLIVSRQFLYAVILAIVAAVLVMGPALFSAA